MFGRRKTPAWFFESETQVEAVSRLLYLTESGNPLGWLTGSGGSGRSTVIEQVRSELKSAGISTIFLDASGMDCDALFWHLATSLHIQTAASVSRFELLLRIRDELLGRMQCRIRTAVLIDNLHRSAGNPEPFLSWLLAQAEQLDGCLYLIGAAHPATKPAVFAHLPLLRIHLLPFSSAESISFIEDLLIARSGHRISFDQPASQALVQLCNGNPARLVRMASLLEVVQKTQPDLRIDRELIESVAEEFAPRRAA
ncbi:MAG: ATP-binding protein [Planctomyces sp.]|nr:ATP-binding protein [Planctomyces sp.]